MGKLAEEVLTLKSSWWGFPLLTPSWFLLHQISQLAEGEAMDKAKGRQGYFLVSWAYVWILEFVLYTYFSSCFSHKIMTQELICIAANPCDMIYNGSLVLHHTKYTIIHLPIALLFDIFVVPVFSLLYKIIL